MTSDNNKSVNERRTFPLARLLPNVLTMMSLFAGLTAVRFAMQARWDMAALAIVIAAVFDVLDGRVARMLNTSSKFGAELDSLADLTSFGVAPSFVLYLWAMQTGAYGFGWAAVLVFTACSALRLARFNTMLEDREAPKWTKSYFTGVPAPAGAGLALLPLFIYLALGADFKIYPVLQAIWMFCAGALMVSRIPTVAMKGRRVAPIFVMPIMGLVCLIGVGLFTHIWATLSMITVIYIFSLPLGWMAYRRRERMEQK
ncbi:MAG: CDP-diacylglycerol--serine O-phosphatidyltransferase [Alphaproteobacteria bacterium]|nr:CDP-diacylglycerol--serine O-phosphatidyltransferase [Alphaproteobacteria bacterium]